MACLVVGVDDTEAQTHPLLGGSTWASGWAGAGRAALVGDAGGRRCAAGAGGVASMTVGLGVDARAGTS